MNMNFNKFILFWEVKVIIDDEMLVYVNMNNCIEEDGEGELD